MIYKTGSTNAEPFFLMKICFSLIVLLLNKVQFAWSVNTSRGIAEIDESLFSSSSKESKLAFTPRDHEPLLLQDSDNTRTAGNRYQDLKTPSGEEIFGVVYCKATSKFGEQLKPCTFVVKPAGNFFYR